MKRLFDRVVGYLNDKRAERKEAKLNARREAMKEAYSYAVPAITVAAMTSVALSGNFSFM